ncbi:RagB/SusD family nutrient uptake outer membrane protein [Chitinophaga arvensicola]|uniref:SusD family protein n=1 Tax=Chitinophaga arvensicola TaxID=29529 RepID=A0A1I0RF19_9BACT|nr:RagB/SusD family nutrient uptake outer membrane protein [Chitinophaga arvensicola]SEW39256.1 SusD family protein [Chitinophaga arvensicola]
MKKLTIYPLLGLLLLTGGCKKFLDVTPKGKFLPTTVADYELFMNDLLQADAGFANIEYMGDDLSFTDDQVTSGGDTRRVKSYLWLKEVYKDLEDDAEWTRMYNNIYNCNLVLQNIETATGGAPSDVGRISAEARIQRAYNYFHLAMLFGKDYDAATAATDLAVPMPLIPDLEAKSKRATVKEVYDQVFTDLNTALATPGLPDFGRNYVHPGKVAAYALLSRIHLYMGNYEQAQKWADAALAMKSTLVDYNTFSFILPSKPFNGVNNKPTADVNPENLFTKTNSASNAVTTFMISPELFQLLGEKDLRYVYTFTRIERSGLPTTNPYPIYFANMLNYSIGVPEMMLIKAECLARSGKKDDALNLLNTLRKQRFKPADYTDLTATDADAALALVMTERRKELLYHGLRWFDLKRLNRDPRFKKDLTRTYKGQLYTLPANSQWYLLEIAPKIISINPAIIQNPR